MQLLFLYFLITCLCDFADANLQDITSGDPPYNICTNSNNYATDSPFENNLYNLLGVLSLNISVTKFSSFYTGDNSDRVYGLYMCFNYNYTTYVDCKNCIATTASQHIVRYCPNEKEAIVWEDSCLLHYSSEDFFGKLDVKGNIPKANSQNVSDPERYRSVVNRSLSTLSKQAAYNPTATREILSCCYFLRGARVHSRSCFLRYELYDFVNGASESSVSSGNQAKGKGSERNIWMIIILTIVAAFVLSGLLACTVYHLTKKKGIRKTGVESQDISGDRNYHQHMQGRDDIEAQEFYIDLKSIHLATDNFSDSNMLGQGGFGPVYKTKEMDKHLLSAMFYLITSMIIFSSFTNANRLELDCPDSSVYTPNSPFEQNLKLLLQSLSSNTSLNGGFYNSSIGDDTNRVYGQALCRGDANHTACQVCIENAVQDILKNCSSEDAIIWYDLCQIHYSSQNFFSINTGYYGKFPDSNDQRKRISDPVLLTEVLKYLMDNITSEASSDPLKFAVGEINFIKSNNIYGLAQCTRDISASYCNSCLSSASVELVDKYGDLEGGIVVDSNCNVRFELQRFYNGSSISLTYPTSGENAHFSYS
ncbi:hypothetical protein Q3G72_004879 [Acer saccharum]|nr:hypothetical protein Q3G72_004879 [Acer saccharum]